MSRQIISIGGGGFSSDPSSPILERYILEHARTKSPSVCFVPTASGDADSYIVKFYTAFTPLTCTPSHLSLFRPPTTDLQGYVLSKDVIYVGGGNTKSMLAVWREWGLVDILLKAVDEDIILTGVSAGGICWFEQAVTDSFAREMRPIDCTGFLPGSCCPHYHGQAKYRAAYHDFIRRGEICEGYGVDDGAALHFVDGELERVVCSDEKAHAFRVERVEDDIRDRVLERHLLVEPAT